MNVYGKPEMSSPAVTVGGQMIGSRVDGEGNIQLPMVDSVHVAGMTASQIQATLRQAFAQYINKPWAVVEVLEQFLGQPSASAR